MLYFAELIHNISFLNATFLSKPMKGAIFAVFTINSLML